MNSDRRKEINKAIALMQQALDILEVARNEEGDYYENMPENLQDSPRGHAAEQSYGYLEDAYCTLEDAINAAHSSMEAYHA